jgi:protoheme IX farnesyltransferase
LLFALSYWIKEIIIAGMLNLTHMKSTAIRVKALYLPLIKFRQTLLLTITGLAGYISRSQELNLGNITGLIGTLLLTISGCTILNMVFDRDIDSKMARTSMRPLAVGLVKPVTASILGISLIGIGLIWALVLSWQYYLLILAGVILDVLVYTLWLKRRSAWSILWGGFSGGMPILAGSALGFGRVDLIGWLLCLAIVSWIPSHNLTLGALFSEDFRKAGVPSFFNVYGFTATHFVIVFSSIGTVLLMGLAFGLLNYSILVLTLIIAGGLGLQGMAIYIWVRPSRQAVISLYKYSSLYMLFAMLLLSLVGRI